MIPGDSTRREFFRRGATIASLGVGAGLSGCTGGGGSGDGSSGSEDGGGDTDSAAVTGSGTSRVDGLEVLDTEVNTEVEDTDFAVTVTVENTGRKVTDLSNYGYEIAVYDASGDDITAYEGGSTGAHQIAPGESSEAIAFTGVQGGSDAVASYEVSVTCGGFSSDEAVYCGTSNTQTTTRGTSVPGDAEYPNEERGTLAKDSVDGLDILGWSSEILGSSEGERQFSVTVVLKNTGSRETDLTEYSFVLTYLDQDGVEIAKGESGMSITGSMEPTIAPGEVRSVELYLSEDVNPDKIARYELSLTCGDVSFGVYCEK